MLDHAGEEAQQLGPLAGVEIAGMAGAEDQQESGLPVQPLGLDLGLRPS